MTVGLTTRLRAYGIREGSYLRGGFAETIREDLVGRMNRGWGSRADAICLEHRVGLQVQLSSLKTGGSTMTGGHYFLFPGPRPLRSLSSFLDLRTPSLILLIF